MLRYLKKLESKDYSLANGMIPLGSCTMKLTAASEIMPITWKEFAKMHPFSPSQQTSGYRRLINDLERWLAHITGFAGTSLQPIAGSMGEYAGLMLIREYLKSKGESDQRNICLIPTSAHGTNPASAAMAGFRVVSVKCDPADGKIDIDDLRSLLQKHGKSVGCIMITYPSTFGIFDVAIREIAKLVHSHGAQVYLDGANMNAQVGLCRPGDLGADVCHLNLHKTFAIPHGGGGPPSAPICCAEHLKEFLPGHPVVGTGGKRAMSPVSGTPWAVPVILPIVWSYIKLMGAEGLKMASEYAILNANYMQKILSKRYNIVYTGTNGYVAHEFILDLRSFSKEIHIEAEDVAKRLMDYGFHAPTMSFPIGNTLMIEPTESESKAEMDRLCNALLQIREEISEVASGKVTAAKSVLKGSPHTSCDIASAKWDRAYSREKAVFPTRSQKFYKFWPQVNRVDNAYGDKNLFLKLPKWEDYN